MDMQITARKHGQPACANKSEAKKDDGAITVVFGDQLKKIINQIHEISPFSNNAADDNDSSLKYSPSSGTGPLVSNAIFKETI